MIEDIVPYFVVFGSALLLTLILTPIVGEVHRRIGMVDKPDERRINKTSIPRGCGIAIVLGVFLTYLPFHFYTGRPLLQGLSDVQVYKIATLSVAIAVLGLLDDKFSLRPRVKLLGQVIIATLVWLWAGLGFHSLWPEIPMWADAFLTIFWIVGAVNAFNLIDGLDGLACGIALIAVIGMSGTMFFIRNPQATLLYFSLAGGLLGFLRYNYNPASVFLGDCGSMFLGFMLSTLPLASQLPNSFMVSVGVPMLAMGVPIFDTSLAILRRSLRHLIARGKGGAEGEVMMADLDHLHHRILRSTGLNQRKTAWILYGVAASLVAIGLVAMSLRSRSAGLWLGTVAVFAIVIFKDATIELFDAGRLLSGFAHASDRAVRKRLFVLSVPFYVFLDLVALVCLFYLTAWALRMHIDERWIKSMIPIRVVSVFLCLVVFKTYRTVWARAQVSNYVRLLLACFFGSILGSVVIYYWPTTPTFQLKAMTMAYGLVAFVVLLFLRMFRGIARDVFYALDCSRLRNRKNVSRILVYGAGLRYRAFRRELVRTTAANDRMIVGIIDDDIFLKGKYIGGIRIYGSINEAKEIINETNADAVVISCQIGDEWLKVVKEILEPLNVKISRFAFSEEPV